MENVRNMNPIKVDKTTIINLEKGKLPPQALELEEAVIGAMMIDKYFMDKRQKEVIRNLQVQRELYETKLEVMHDLKKGCESKNGKLIEKIEEAIERIKNKDYGYCEETDEEIGIKRLEARPIATLCIEAQERHERQEKQYIDSESDDR